MSTYQWAAPPTVPDTLTQVHHPAVFDEAFADGVAWVLRKVGLLDLLEKVTGNGAALHAAAKIWLEQAHVVRGVAGGIRRGASSLPEAWRGDASAAFGTCLGQVVADLDRLTADLADTARILNQAGDEAGIAEDLVVGIVTEAAEWAVAELAATVVADIFTLGLASLVGGLAESATMAVFVERAAKVSAHLGVVLNGLARELDDLKTARTRTARESTPTPR